MINYLFIESPLYCKLIIDDEVKVFQTKQEAIKYVEKHQLELNKFEYMYQRTAIAEEAGRGPL